MQKNGSFGAFAALTSQVNASKDRAESKDTFNHVASAHHIGEENNDAVISNAQLLAAN